MPEYLPTPDNIKASKKRLKNLAKKPLSISGQRSVDPNKNVADVSDGA